MELNIEHFRKDDQLQLISYNTAGLTPTLFINMTKGGKKECSTADFKWKNTPLKSGILGHCQRGLLMTASIYLHLQYMCISSVVPSEGAHSQKTFL